MIERIKAANYLNYYIITGKNINYLLASGSQM